MERARIEKISKALADATRLMIFEAISAKNSPTPVSSNAAAKGSVSTTALFPTRSLSTHGRWRKWPAEKILACASKFTPRGRRAPP